MGKILVIAEKPSVGRDIAKVLGCGQKGDGFLYGERHVVSWAVGHLVTLFEPDDYTPAWKRWSNESLPMIPEETRLKAVKGTVKQFNLLKKMLVSPKIDSVICATDSGREGELIFRYIYALSGCVKPFSRLWISSMTDAAIKDGLNRLKPGAEYDNLYQSARCRSEADWLVGMNATRSYTIRYNALLSVGRVQTPTLAIIVERQKEINAFKPADYFEVTADFGDYSGKWVNGESETKIEAEADADAVIEKTLGKTGAVASAENEEKRVSPPQFYDLTELQRDANKKLGLSASGALAAAQTLYEKRKLITYPRTDSRVISEDIVPGLPKLISRLQAVDVYAEYAGYCLSLPKLPVTKRFADNAKVTDHHAIIPTDAKISLSGLSAGERGVYDLIARRFLAAFYPAYVYNAASVITVIEGERFLSRGSAVVHPGWTEVYGKDERGGENALPSLSEGEVRTAVSVVKEKKKTQPPKPYTEAALLSAMERAGRFVEDEELKESLKENGLGTPATRAAIIERLLEVGYVVRKGKTLAPTEKGVSLISVVPKELKSPETTGKWEKALSMIAKGEMEPAKFIGSIERYVKFIVEHAKESETEAAFPDENKRRAAQTRLKRKVKS